MTRVSDRGTGGQQKMAQDTGSYLISWSQTCVEGLRSPPVPALETGATWSWSGDAVPLDPPGALPAAADSEALRRRALRAVRRLLGPALPPVRPVTSSEFADIALSRAFVLSCGRRDYRATLVDVPEAARPLLLFTGRMPPRDRPLRVVEGLCPEAPLVSPLPEPGGVICFTAGTRLATPGGARPVESLREGDRVNTRDGGPQEILWIGHRRLTGAQMHALPELRPVRIRAGALAADRPDADLVVSPRHRVLIEGRSADALFGTREVLVAAEDLVNDRSVLRDHAAREVTYIHLLLPRHHIVRANGVETESFHPASTDLRTVDPHQFDRLARIVPGVQANPRGYGDPVRRELSRVETRALLSRSARPH
jgi:hypothetical protein